jgi:hypothetical protein
MSLLRREVADGLRRWREPAVSILLLLIGLWLTWRGYQALAPLAFVAGLLAAGVGVGLLRPALRRLTLTRAAEAEGVVAIDEARIGYLGPRDGGYIDLPALVAVEIRTDTRRGPAWVLRSREDVLTIPFGARGAAGLFDALSALPGIDFDAALRAAATPHPKRIRIWEQPRPRRQRRLLEGHDE